MKKLFFAFAVFCLIGLIATFPIQSSFRAKAKLIQRVQSIPGNEMFGDDGTPIGKPMLLIIEDQQAFKGTADDTGTYFVDENYLTEHKIHPLQLKTVEFIASICQFAFAMSALILGFIGWRLKSKTKAVDGS